MNISQLFYASSRRLAGLLLSATFATVLFAANAYAKETGGVTPGNIDFGAVVADGTQKVTKTVTIKNNSATDDLTIGAIKRSGVEFTVTADSCANSTIMVGETCDFDITYKPSNISTPGEVSTGTVTVQLPLTALKERKVNLVGTALVAQATSTDSSLDFAQVPLNVSSQQKTVTISNTGNADLKFKSFTVTEAVGTEAGTFNLAANSGCNATNATIAPRASCSLAVSFTATTVGVKAATLTVKPTTGQPQTLSFALAGEGVLPPPPPPPPDPRTGTGTGTGTGTDTGTGTETGTGTGTKDPALSLFIGSNGKKLTSLRVKRGKKITLPYTTNVPSTLKITIVNSKKKQVFTLTKTNSPAGNGKLTFLAKKLKPGRYKINIQATTTSQTANAAVSLTVR